MSVGLLLITHPGLTGPYPALLERLLGRIPLSIACFEVDFDSEAELLLPKVSRLLRQLDQGDGVLILTDLYGASPSNLAAQLGQFGVSVRWVSGMNLPMLLRICNYCEQSLDELAHTAASGGRTGIISGHV